MSHGSGPKRLSRCRKKHPGSLGSWMPPPSGLTNGMKQDKRDRDDHTRLLLKAGCGDVEAFERLHAALHAAVRDYLASLDGSMDYHQRQDLVQEVFFRTWKNASRFADNASAKTFLFAVAKNVLRQELSRRQGLRIVYTEDLDHLAAPNVPDEPTNPHQGDPDELAQVVRQAMAKLTEAQRQAVELDQICNLPREEALKLASCTPNQFANRLYRAMESLKRLLSDLPKCILL